MDKINCPYCDEVCRIDTSDINTPDEDYEEECPHCGKFFSVEVEYVACYKASKMPCWNGEEHDWRVNIMAGYPTARTVYCRNCGERRCPTDEEYNTKLNEDYAV